jgi:hypothetical protein
MTKAVAPATSKEVAAVGAFDASMFATGSTGFENVTQKDLMIPRITILQALSPQCVEGKPQYNEKFRPGNYFDTGMNEQYGKTLDFLPVHFTKQYLIWAPRESGKGLQGISDDPNILNDTEKDMNGRDVLPDGNYVVETAQFFGVNLLNLRLSYIAMVSTQLKKSRQLLMFATSEYIPQANGEEVQAPLWYRSYKLGTTPESNAKGSWAGYTVERSLSIPEMAQIGETDEEKAASARRAKRIYDMVVSFRQKIDSGEVKADTSTLEEEMAGEGSGSGGGSRRRAQSDEGQEM